MRVLSKISITKRIIISSMALYLLNSCTASREVSQNETQVTASPSPRQESLPASQVLSQQPHYAVVSVGDGDTFRAKTQSGKAITVRIACTDAPETRQAFGTEASKRLKQLLPIGSAIELKIGDTDRYGRTVAEAIANGQSVGLQLIREGYAVAYRQYLRGCDAQAYLAAEETARAQRLNFWSQENPVMPWDFRRGKTSTPQAVPKTPTQPSLSTTNQNLPACVNGDCDCKDFATQTQAQQVLDLTPGDDPHRLDRDGDRIACESLK
jgi:micrococcal nuclease